MRVELPVIPRLGVAARPVQREVQIRQLIRGGKGDAVVERADGVPAQLSIHGNGDGGIGHWRSAACDQRDVVHVKDRLPIPGPILEPEPGKIRLVGNPQGSE